VSRADLSPPHRESDAAVKLSCMWIADPDACSIWLTHVCPGSDSANSIQPACRLQLANRWTRTHRMVSSDGRTTAVSCRPAQRGRAEEGPAAAAHVFAGRADRHDRLYRNVVDVAPDNFSRRLQILDPSSEFCDPISRHHLREFITRRPSSTTVGRRGRVCCLCPCHDHRAISFRHHRKRHLDHLPVIAQ